MGRPGGEKVLENSAHCVNGFYPPCFRSMKIICLLVELSGGRGPGLEGYDLSQLSHPAV